jgi:hypothetical protein
MAIFLLARRKIRPLRGRPVYESLVLLVITIVRAFWEASGSYLFMATPNDLVAIRNSRLYLLAHGFNGWYYRGC